MERMLYVITAQVYTSDADGYAGSRQIPTFYLDPAIQGITDARHARKIAGEIIDPMGKLVVNVHVESRTVVTAPF